MDETTNLYMGNQVADIAVAEKKRDNFRDDMVKQIELLVCFHDAIKIAKDVANCTQYEMVHCSSVQPTPGKTRSIVEKFAFFNGRGDVRRQWKQLNVQTVTFFHQSPPDVLAKRRRLVTKIKESRGKANDQG
ncbi:hypothetical protein DPMN_180847 [Dreissena polymorpha]|uniref:Uncharacterized protein n=1 Tax=Dreissena polymorpha TaxID=45954 RepID=A0A9D4I374_DREPO|nr:hypothetical protein DPMN_180847 [Dreissena polymorpha]